MKPIVILIIGKKKYLFDLKKPGEISVLASVQAGLISHKVEYRVKYVYGR